MKLKTDKEEIIKILSDFFGENLIEIKKWYESLKESYEQILCSTHAGFIKVEKFKDIKFTHEETKNNWDNATLIGIDLPLSFEQKENVGTIMVVGIDPLRKRKDFPKGDVIIGTPYALHSTFYREKRSRTKVYYDFSKYIFDKGYNVYLTDIYKVWINKNDNEKEKFHLGREIERAKNILQKEVKIIKPKIIIAFGNEAEKLCKNIVDSNMVYKLPHPSGRNKGWKELINGSATCDAKTKYLTTEIDKYLNNIS